MGLSRSHFFGAAPARAMTGRVRMALKEWTALDEN